MKKDWNDFLLEAGSGEEARKCLDEHRREYEGQARLILAENPQDYARIYSDLRGYPPGLFEFFDGQYYFATRELTVRVSNFTLRTEHFRLDTQNPEQHEYQYRLKVIPQKGRPKTFNASAEEISAPDMLTKLFLKRGRVLWEGSKLASVALVRKILASGAREVRQLNAVGLDLDTGCYVFRDFLITPDGKKVLPNKNGIFELSSTTAIRPFSMATLNPEEHLTAREIYQGIYEAWGLRGVIGMAFLVSSPFVTQVKDKLGFFPFLSNYGDHSSGKTFLMVALNAMQCLDEEGLPMSRENTAKGELRFLSQISGLSRALLEANKDKAYRFDFNKLLPLYNKNFLQVRAVKSNDNQTHEMDWRGTLILVQNVEPTKTAAQKSRLISVKFEKTDIEGTKEAFDRVQSWKKEWLAQFFVEVMAHRQQFEEEWYPTYCRIDRSLERDIPEPRIRANHSLILTFHEILCEVLKLGIDPHSYVVELAQKKIQDCQRHVSNLADFFFDAIYDLPSEDRDQCLQTDDEGRLHLWLPNAIKVLKNAELPPINLAQLQDDLQSHPGCLNSRHSSRKFAQFGGTPAKHVYLFDPKKINEQDDTTGTPDEEDDD